MGSCRADQYHRVSWCSDSETLGAAAFDSQKGPGTHLASVRSALKAWHLFAVLIHMFAATALFPTMKGSDVEVLVSCFQRGDKVGHYVGASAGQRSSLACRCSGTLHVS